MNLKHGFYSKNPSINPDSVMLNNQSLEVKNAILSHHADIKAVVTGKIVKPGVTDFVAFLLDCALPHNGHLLPKSHLDEIEAYYRSRTFSSIRRSTIEKSFDDLKTSYKHFN